MAENELSTKERLLSLQNYVNSQIGENLPLTDGIKKLVKGEGGADVTMTDNPNGGVDLTVDDQTRTLATESEVTDVKAELTQLETTVETDGQRITALENTPIPEQAIADGIENYLDTHGGVYASQIELNNLENYLGYVKDYADLRNFTTSNPNNWRVTSTKNSVTVEHLTEWTGGAPEMPINLPSGSYVWKADYHGVVTPIAIYKNGAFLTGLQNIDTFTIEDGNTYKFVCGKDCNVTDVSITLSGASADGKIQEIETNINSNSSNIEALEDIISKMNISENVVTVSSYEIKSATYISKLGVITENPALSGYKVYMFNIKPNTPKCYIVGNSVWGNAIFAFYDDSLSLVQIGQLAENSSAGTRLDNIPFDIPNGATKIAIQYVNDPPYIIPALKVSSGYTIKKWKDYKWVCVGDSLTDVTNTTATERYFDYVNLETGINIVNMGVSGSGYARKADENNAFYQRVQSIDTTADVVTVFGSFNDVGSGLPLGTVTDNTTSTIAGCINKTIDVIQEKIPLVRLGIVSPTPWENARPATSGSDYNYVEMLKSICELRSIPFLDLWRGSNLRPWDESFRLVAYTHDNGNGVHPDENGHKIIAPKFKAFLETLLM